MSGLESGVLWPKSWFPKKPDLNMTLWDFQDYISDGWVLSVVPDSFYCAMSFRDADGSVNNARLAQAPWL
tara:strand:+ start:561 stop:770 length:210 start_codon:yes stop_codon:yes gene_type:complete